MRVWRRTKSAGGYHQQQPALPVMPLGAAFRYAAGVQHDWNKDFSVGGAYTLIAAGTAKISRTGGPLEGDLEGKYDTNFIHAFNVK
jgi:hypothetical protein